MDGRTDRDTQIGRRTYDKANSRSSQFCKRAYNHCYTLYGNILCVFYIWGLDRWLLQSAAFLAYTLAVTKGCWRIFNCPFHEIHSTVFQLSVHLENEQMFTSFTKLPLNVFKQYPIQFNVFIHLHTVENLVKYCFIVGSQCFPSAVRVLSELVRRKNGKILMNHPEIRTSDNGHDYTVQPNNSGCFYVRLLLLNVA